MLVGQQAAENRRVRRQRDDGMGVREGEARAVARESIQVRRLRRAAVRRQRVGPERVDGHEQDVLIAGLAEDEAALA